MKDGEGILCVHVCIHASDYEYTVCCMMPGAKWSQIVPVRLRGKGVECKGVCGLGVDWRIGGRAASGSLESLYMDPHHPLVLLIVTFAHTMVNRQPII